MPTPIEIADQMRQALAISEPDLDTSVGTPIRKILDVVAETISEAYADRYLLSYQYDIDSRSGEDLDAFVALFGFARLVARRATGTVLLQRDTPAPTPILLPVNSQIATTSTPPVIVQTISSTVFPQGATSITVTVQAVRGGSVGNVSSNTLVRWVTPVEGIVAVSNPAPLTGGMDAETDAQLRERFKRSVFRNMAGTEDMYLGIALDDKDVSAATVLGPSERWREQIEIVGGTAVSTISTNTPTLELSDATNATPIVVTTTKAHHLYPGNIVTISGVTGNTAANGTFRVKTTPSTTTFSLSALDGSGDVAGTGGYSAGGDVVLVERAKWVYDTSYFFGTNIDNGLILTPDVHYTLDTTVIPPVVTSIDPTNCPDGIYDLSFNYVPIASRNDPVLGITNRVDVFENADRAQVATETAVCNGAVVVSATPGGTTGYNRWKRLDGSYPEAGNIIMRLSFAPVIDLPETIDVGDDTLSIDTDYWLVNEIGPNVGAWNSFAGVEISASAVEADTMSIASSTNASPVVVTVSAPHSITAGQYVKVEGHLTNTDANGVWRVSSVGASTITLEGSVGNGVGGATGTVVIYTPVLLDYDYNAVPRDIQVAIEQWRMLTTDVVVHKGVPIPLKIHLAVILRSGYTTSGLQAAVDQAVSEYLSQLLFGGQMQVSDLLNVIGDVTGIDAVRLLNSDDLTTISVSDATNATPIVLTVSVGHGYVAGDLIQVEGITGNTAANGVWVVQTVGSTTITLKGSSGNGAYSAGGTVRSGDYAINRMEEDGSTPRTLYVTTTSPYRAVDIQSADNEFFVLHSVVMNVRASNTWGTV